MFYGYRYQRVLPLSDDDGGDTVEQIGSVTDDEGKSFSAEFGEIDAGEQADGQAHHRGEKQQLEAADGGVGHAAAGFAVWFGKLREEIPAQRSAAVPDQIAED